MIASSFRSNDVFAFINSVHSTTAGHMESTGVKLGRDKSRRRLPHERPRFNENGEKLLRGQRGPESEEEENPAKAAMAGMRRSKSLHAKATGGEETHDSFRERTLLSWHSSRSQRKKRQAEKSDHNEVPAPIEGGTSTESLVFKSQGQEPSTYPIENLAIKPSDDDFIKRLVGVVGDISCPVHPDRSIQSCPRECGWHIEHHIERGKSSDGDTEKSPITRSDSSTLVPSLSQTESMPSTFTEIQHPPKRYSLGIRPCYILILLGLLSIAGSLAPALWRANVQGDFSGGFTLAQYILGVGIFVVGSMVAIHSRACTCWQS